MLFSSPIFRPVVSVSNNHERGQDAGGTPLYKPYRYVLPKGKGFWAFLVWKHFTHFGLESGMVFEEVREGTWMGIYIVSSPNE